MAKSECVQVLRDVLQEVEVFDIYATQSRFQRTVKERIKFIESHKFDKKVFELIVKETVREKQELIDLKDGINECK